MKKYVIAGVLAILMIMPIIGAANITNNKIEVQSSDILSGDDFTHTVIGEYVTTTSCGYCPTASSQLYSIYNSEDYEFYYITLVADMNSKIYSRVTELGTTGLYLILNIRIIAPEINRRETTVIAIPM